MSPQERLAVLSVLRFELRHWERSTRHMTSMSPITWAICERFEKLIAHFEAGGTLPGPRRKCRCGRSYYVLDGHVCVGASRP